MKVYLAARFSAKDEVAKRAEELKELGIECTSSWLQEKSSPNTTMDQHDDSFLLSTAMIDVADIKRSNAVVMFSVDPKEGTPRGGRHFESGYAYGLGKPLIICGPVENIFHLLPNVTVYSTFEQVKKDLLRRKFYSEGAASISNPCGNIVNWGQV
jgi:nucleoside 2-deoxyribosyltransferase